MFHAVQLSKSDPTPLYIQLANNLAHLIQQDILQKGMKLPTIRSLSKELCINRDTVVSAYKLLEQQGLVESHIGKGTYITSIHHNIPLAHPIAPLNHKAHICCSHLNLSESFFPSSLCQDLATQVISKEGWEAFADPFYREKKALKQSAADFLIGLGIQTHFAQVQVISHLEDFFINFFRLSPKIGVCVETPRDLTLSCFLKQIGAKIFEIPLTPNGMDLDILEKYLKLGSISCIILSPYLQNPTGICYSRVCQTKILELAKQYHCLIIEDGTYCDFLWDLPYSPLYNQSNNENVLYLYHFSKVYMPYMKYSFAALPLNLVKIMKDSMSCSFNERFLHYYLASHTFSVIQKQILETCKCRYQYLIKQFSLLAPYLTYEAAYGGLSVWCKIPESIYPDFCQKLVQKEIIIAPCELFFNTNITGYFRLSISDLSFENIDELIALFKQLLMR